MSEVKTLNEYIPKLKTLQQDFIVNAVKQYCDRPDLHRGLLPFLPVDEAARALKYALEHVKAAQNTDDIAEQGKAALGERFIRQTLSVFAAALLYQVDDDQASEVITLKTVRLKKAFQHRFAKKFSVALDADFGVPCKNPASRMFELQMVGRDRWKVTGHKDYVSIVTDDLASRYNW